MQTLQVGDQIQFGQLYVNAERSRSKEYVEKLENGGCKALFITVDAPQLGRREKDMRNKFTEDADVQKDDDVQRDEGVAKAIGLYAYYFDENFQSYANYDKNFRSKTCQNV